MMKNIHRYRNSTWLYLFLLLSTAPMLTRSNDPFSEIQYEQVFDQKAIYKKYSTLMRKLGCADNVFQVDNDADVIAGNSKKISDRALHDILNPVFAFDAVKDAKELAAFEKECMDQLNYARRMALVSPTAQDLSNLAFTAALGGGLVMAQPYVSDFRAWLSSKLGRDNTSTEYVQSPGDRSVDNAFFSAMFTALISLKGMIGSGYNLMYWPDNPLADLENYFAKNKCYIPRALWPKIENKFMAARHDFHNRDAHKYFLDFALGFTVYKPKKKIHFKDDMSSQDVKHELGRRIDAFFADYKDSLAINYIKINVAKFVDALMQGGDGHVFAAPRYLYLYGSGGIGKTHFVQTLSGWIDELIPQSVRFEDVIIESPEDLEGSDGRPGAMLKALRNQLLENRRGSVIMIDEATWLNYNSMISSAKRLFNGDRSKLTTSFFGTNIDGTAVSLEMPPMLIFVASNELIADPALASRFDTIRYPVPSEQALVDHAIRIAKQSHVLQQVGCPIDEELIKQWVYSLEQEQRNFRFVAGNIEAVLLVVHNQMMKTAMTS